MDEFAIHASGIRKVFNVPLEHRASLREHVAGFFSRVERHRFVALDEISFSLEKGEFLGVIGPNGSGKTTLMRVIAGIYPQDEGSVRISGAIAPLLELGIGFNDELSARDNILVNGTIMGMSRSFLKENADDILEYAGISEFGNMKIKNFSSGMRSRLAFAVASRVEADIYLMDEVMAVGDHEFNERCMARLDQLKSAGKTILLVTHDMEAVRKHSNRCLLLDQGRLVADGTPEECITRYLGPQ